mmetsp:Transcript_27371/g.59884  ORF Transcript_27371/g.59884 Transcript_27371/m.59884 type:complete len:88 (-) Transcript_27371:1704-1967(-)
MTPTYGAVVWQHGGREHIFATVLHLLGKLLLDVRVHPQGATAGSARVLQEPKGYVPQLRNACSDRSGVHDVLNARMHAPDYMQETMS